MFHFTFCGGSEVRLKDPDNVVITFWGGTEILLPTLADKMMRMRVSAAQDDMHETPIRRTNVITFQGGTVLMHPTLAREIESMLHLKESGAFSTEELMKWWKEAISREDLDSFEFVTIMGGAGEERPSVKRELSDLNKLAARGLISNEDIQELTALLQQGTSSDSANYLREKIKSYIFPVSTPSLEEPRRRELPRSALHE